MHDSARTFLTGVSATWRHPRNAVVEFGSLNVNGSAREVIDALSWWGIDLVNGEGVDQVADAARWDPPDGVYIDTVVCTEVLEHTPDGAAICANAYRILAPGGVFLVTCAGPGRTPHGAHGQLHPAAGEWYAGVTVTQLAGWLHDAGFVHQAVVAESWQQRDVWALAIRNPDPDAVPAPSPPPPPDAPTRARTREGEG